MTTLYIQRSYQRWRFWTFWMLAGMLSVLAFMLVVTPLNFIMASLVPRADTTAAASRLALALGIGLLGSTLGLAQWFLLKNYMTRMGGWVLATTAGYALGGAMRWDLPPTAPPWLEGALMLLTYGIILGLVQWLVLREKVLYAGLWIPITIAGWALAYLLTVAAYISGLYIEPFDLFSAYFVPIAVTGMGMAWLLQHPQA